MQVNRRSALALGLAGIATAGCDALSGFEEAFTGSPTNAAGYNGPLRFVADEAWRDNGFEALDVRIGVIDAGFGGFKTSPATAGLEVAAVANFVDPAGFDSYSDQARHGTEMCTFIGGRDGASQTGLATKASYYLAKGEDQDSEPLIEETRVTRALDWLVSQGVNVISISLGYSTFDDGSPYRPDDMTGSVTAVSAALHQHLKRDPDLIAVVSAGNLGRRDWRMISFPGDVRDALTVGSVENDLTRRRPTSGRGLATVDYIKPDLCVPTGRGATSVATAIVSGLAACLKGAYPEATRAEIGQALRSSATNASTPNREIGYGVPQAAEAARVLQQLLDR